MVKLEQEVAERKRAEAALRLSEQCFRAIADYTYFWEIWVGPDGQPLWINPAVQRVTGYTIKELMEMKDYPMPLIYEEDKGKVRRAFGSALKGSTGKGLEFRIRRKDETVIWASMSWQPIYDEKGASQGHRASVHDITNRKHTEEALAHERDFLHILMENMPDTIYFKDTASRFTRINTAQAKLLGSTPEEAVGKTDFDFFPRELAERYYADEQAIFQSGKPLIDQEEPTIDNKGNRIWVSTTKVPLRDKEGNIVGLVGICRDITGHKRAEDALKLTQFSLDNSADAAFWMGPDAQFVYVNNAACRSLGYSRQELLSMTVHDIDPDFPREAWPEHWEEVRQRGSFTLESHHRRKDGKVFPTEISINYIKFGGKEYNCAFARDITERKKAEESLDLRNRAIAGATNGIIITEHRPPDNPIIYVNPAFERITGYCSSEVLGKDCRFLQGPEQQQPALKQVRQTIQKERDCRVVVRNYRKDGSLFWNELSISPVRDEQGKLTHFIGVISDITERKRAEEALQESKERYHALVENIELGITLVDADHNILMTNSAVGKLFGEPASEFIGKKCYNKFEKRGEICPHCPGEKAMKTGQAEEVETEGVRDDGNRLPVRIQAFPLFSEDGKATGFIEVAEDITEYKRTEQALRQSQQMLQSVLDTIPARVFWKDLNSVYIGCNKLFAKDAGVDSPEAIVGKTDYDFAWEKEQADFFRECDRRVMDSDTPEYHIIEPQLQADGTRAWLSTNKVPLHDTDGKVVGILGTYEDVTERRQAEEKIEKLAKFPGENPNSVLRVSTDGTILYCNQASRPLLELWKCKIGRVIPARWQQYIQQAFSSGQAPRAEVKCADRIFSLTFAPVADSNYVNIYALDITERRQAEEMLRESEAQYRAVFEQAADSIVLIDAQTGVMVRFNDRAHQDLGYTRDEFEKLKIPDFEVIESAVEVAEHIRKIIKEGADTFETRQKTKNGEIRNILVSARAVSIGGKDFIQAIWRDITEHKQAEAAREKLNKELEEKNKELESILFVASHDLKSPLVNIQGFGNELARSCDLVRLILESKEKTADMEKKLRLALDESIPEALGFIFTSANKMDSLLSGLLRLSRLGSASMEARPLDINALLAGVAGSMEYQIKKIGVLLEIEQLPSCVGDASQINQVFSNLLDNALKFLDDSRAGMIRIYGRVEDGQSIYCVEDNGVGIAPDHQNKIFEIFHQLEPDQKSGEGLGLTIVRRIVDRHNGKIWVESEPGKGSSFFVSLPSV
jgi:PAS domain S-box-containing protein